MLCSLITVISSLRGACVCVCVREPSVFVCRRRTRSPSVWSLSRPWSWRSRSRCWITWCSGAFPTSEPAVLDHIPTCRSLLSSHPPSQICSGREFLGQGWMKVDKTERTPYIMKTSQHFNDVGLKTSLHPHVSCVWRSQQIIRSFIS